MWETPKRGLPARNEPVVCITSEGDVVWLKRLDGDQWLESDVRGRSRGNLVAEPVAWTHAPRLPQVKDTQ